jgi:hypothetical protein
LLNHGKNGASSLTLIAPDPKYKRNPRDRIESAYDEAKQLWHTKKKPGKKFTSKLKKIIENFGNDKFRVVYSKLDTIATWPGNVAKMHTDLGGNGNWHEIKVAGNSSPKDLPIKLEPTQAKNEHWIHEQLFEKLATPARS